MLTACAAHCRGPPQQQPGEAVGSATCAGGGVPEGGRPAVWCAASPVIEPRSQKTAPTISTGTTAAPLR